MWIIKTKQYNTISLTESRVSSYWSEVVTVLAWTKQKQCKGQCGQSSSGHKVMQQANITHIMITKTYDPQQKHRLGTVSKKKDCRINHRSTLDGLKAVFYPPKPQGRWWHAPVEIYFAASHVFRCYPKTNPLEFMTYGRKINFNFIWDTAWGNLSSEMCEQVRQVFHVRADISAIV